MRGFKEQHVPLPPRILQHPQHWRLERWLVKPGTSVHREQRIASFRSLSNAALEYVLAPRSGKLVNTFLQNHSPVDPNLSPLALIEFCPHSVVFKGICAVCGETAQSLHFADTKHTVERIPVAYDAAQLAVSRAEAESRSSVNARYLLASQRLSLVLDLDHTLVHATDDARASDMISCFPPHVDMNSVRAFQLGPVTQTNNSGLMHVKLRPHLAHFLQRLSSKFELHIYTMGTRAYAAQIASIIDPGKKLFGGRITSREDFAEGRMNQKSIQRLFPCDDSMVLIVDDREDVWISATGQLFMPNLVRAEPYHFWDGLHEIYNRAYATYTVQRLQEIGHSMPAPLGGANAHDTAPTALEKASANVNMLKASEPSENGHEVKQTNGMLSSSAPHQENVKERSHCPSTHHKQAGSSETTNQPKSPDATEESGHGSQEKVVDVDLIGNLKTREQSGSSVSSAEHKGAERLEKEPPSKQPQEQKDAGSGGNLPHSTNGVSVGKNSSLSSLVGDLVKGWWEKDTDPKVSNHLLKLAHVLEECHSRFFAKANQIRKENGTVYGGPSKSFRPPADVKTILAQVRGQVLRDCVLSFTGIIPRGENPRRSSLWLLARRLGAQCCLEFETGRSTHLVASQDKGKDTKKHKQAVESGCAFVVLPSWVEACSLNFERQDEFDYQLEKDDRFRTSEEYKSWVTGNFAKAASSCRKRSVVQMYDKQPGDECIPQKRRKLDSRSPSVRGSGSRSPVAEGGMLSILSQDEIGAAIEAAFAAE